MPTILVTSSARSCDAPEVPQHVILQCSANYTYNSACAYTCKPGYGPIDGAVNVRICTIDKNINEMVWTGRKGGCKGREFWILVFYRGTSSCILQIRLSYI